MAEHTDCRSPEGELVALIDSAIIILRLISRQLPQTAAGMRDPLAKPVMEALKDLAWDREATHVLTLASHQLRKRHVQLVRRLDRLKPAERAELKRLGAEMMRLPLGVPEDDEAFDFIRDSVAAIRREQKAEVARHA